VARKRVSIPPAVLNKRYESWRDTTIPAHPTFAMLCAQSLVMWTAGADPEEIAEWLENHREDCPVPLDDQIFAVRGLKPYRRGGILDFAPGFKQLLPPPDSPVP
jgi:hypothetical protein